MNQMHKCRIISVSNNKGGVGKSSSATTLASIMAQEGKSILLVDLDAQANATVAFLKERPKGSIYNSMVNREDLPIVNIKEYDNGGRLDLVPANLQMSWIDLNLAGEIGRELILRDVLEPATEKYDIIILDCPPSLGLIAQNAFAAATDVLIPLNADAFSVEGLSMVISFFNTMKKRINPQLNLLGMVITQFEKNTLTRSIDEVLSQSFAKHLFKTKIRKNVAVGKAQSLKTDLLSYDSHSNAALDYMALYGEIKERLGLE